MRVYDGEYNRVIAEEQASRKRREESERALRLAKEKQRQLDERAKRQGKKDQAYAQRLIDEQMAKLTEGFGGLQEELRAKMGEYLSYTHRQMSSLSDEIRGVEERAQKLDEKISKLDAETRRRFEEIARALNGENERARFYGNEFSRWMSQIRRLHPDKLLPNEYAGLQQKESFVRINMSNNAFAEATGLAQSGIAEVMTIHARLEDLNAKFQGLKEAIAEVSERLGARFRSLQKPEKNREKIIVEEEEVLYDGHIDYWTNGMFQQANENYYQMARTVQELESQMDIPGMEQALALLLQIEGQLDECIEVSRREFDLSCRIGLMAERIHRAMISGNTWVLGSSGFSEEDPRNSYMLCFHDNYGNTASIVIMTERRTSTDGSKPVMFAVNISDGDPIKQKELCEILYRGVLDILDEHGIAVDRESKYQAVVADQFVRECTERGSKYKKERLSHSRTVTGMAN